MGIIITLIILALLVIVGLFLSIKLKRKETSDLEFVSLKTVAIIFTITATIALILTWFTNSYQQIQTGQGGVVKTFGKVELSQPALTEGLNWIKPWQHVEEMSHQQTTFDRKKVVVQAKDKVPMLSDVSFHSVLNYDAMPYILQNYGRNYSYSLLETSAASALRMAASEFNSWDEIQIEKKLEFQQKITDLYKSNVVEKLKVKGVPADIAKHSFEFPQVDLRNIVPQDQSLIDEIAATKAAVQKGTRKLQEIKNAQLDALKRGQDGVAIRDTILRVLYSVNSEGQLPKNAELPENIDLQDLSQFILAISAIKKAEAVELAAEKGELKVMVTGGATSLAVPAPQ